MDIPKDGFWHCRITLKVKNSSAVQKNMTYAHIIEHIVRPFRNNKEFNVGGKVIHGRSGIDTIILYHTKNTFESYGTESWGENIIAIPIELGWQKGTDYTQALLYSSGFNINFEELKLQTVQPSHVINVNQVSNQNQSVEINISSIYSNIENLQDVFDSFRSSIAGIADTDQPKLIEAQDALDGLSSTSNKQEVCGALNKVKRCLKSAENGIIKVGSMAANAAELTDNIGKLKKAYNVVAPIVGLPTI